MTGTKLLKFGTASVAITGPHAGKKTGWVALANANLARQQSGDLLIGQQCFSRAEVEGVVTQIRAELDDILMTF